MGMLLDTTVWSTLSLLVQVTVLFTPMITVILAEEYPGAPAALPPAPFGIVTLAPVDEEEDEDVFVEDVVQPSSGGTQLMLEFVDMELTVLEQE
jgi:hypothetical protein